MNRVLNSKIICQVRARWSVKTAKKYMCMFCSYFYPNISDTTNFMVFAVPVKDGFFNIYYNTSVSVTNPILPFRLAERFDHEIICQSVFTQPCFRECYQSRLVRQLDYPVWVLGFERYSERMINVFSKFEKSKIKNDEDVERKCRLE